MIEQQSWISCLWAFRPYEPLAHRDVASVRHDYRWFCCVSQRSAVSVNPWPDFIRFAVGCREHIAVPGAAKNERSQDFLVFFAYAGAFPEFFALRFFQVPCYHEIHDASGRNAVLDE